MGIFSAIGGFIRSIARRITGRSEEAPKEEKKEYPEGVDRIIGAEETTREEETEEDFKETFEGKKVQEETEAIDKEEDKLKRFKDKNKAMKPKFEYISDSKRKDWESILNERKVLIKTGFYNSFESLMNSRFDIYRNVIMGAISESNPNSRELIQKIFRSGIIEEHIVARVVFTLRSTTSGKSRLWDSEVEIQGLTPDKAINYNIFSLKGMYESTDMLRRSIERVCNTELIGFSGGEYGEVEVVNVNISFNYA